MRGLGKMLGVVGVVLATAACGSDPSPTDAAGEPSEVPDGRSEVTTDSASVSFGSTVVVAGVEVTYLALEGDSRCPIGVTCFWEGDAEVRVRADDGSGAVEEALHTSLEPRSVRAGSAQVTLIDVLPTPVDGRTTEPDETSIVVRVAPAGG